LFGLLFICLILSMPVAVSLGLSAIITIWLLHIPLLAVTSIIEATVTKFTLLAIPFFILSGIVMQKGGISKRLISLASIIIGPITGGLGIAAIVTAMFFSAISGSGPATVAAIGVILVPAMIKIGYDDAFATSIVSASGALGIVIPPSIAFIIYGMLANVSIGDLFIAGILPGILVGFCFIGIVIIVSKKHNYKELSKKRTLNEAGKVFIDAFWGILSPVIVLGGIYGGIFTPTEAAAVAAVYSIFVSVFIYRGLKWSDFIQTLLDAAITTAIIMLIVANAGLFAWVLTREGIASSIARTLLNITSNKIIILLMINVVFLMAGCIMDAVSSFYVLLPIVLPIANEMGLNLLVLGVILTVNLSIGLITPPVGANLYIGADIGKVSLEKLIKRIFPFILAALLALTIMTFIPQIITFLPNILRK